MLNINEPGGCECQCCGTIFIGQPAETICSTCLEKLAGADWEGLNETIADMKLNKED